MKGDESITMFTFQFYYDESEHSRKINYNTVTASNYYDNFVTVIVGWTKEKEKEVFENYAAFEDKYAERKDRDEEIKSTTLKQKQFEFGFASLNKANIKFVDDFLSVFDEKMKLYFSVASKMEYLVLQLFLGYENNFFIDADAMKYTITKALVTYRPDNVIKCIYDCPEQFVDVLKDFFGERIERNKINMKLKEQENNAFQEILCFLDDISAIPILQWDYHMAFDGFKKYLEEEQVENYSLLIDKEGEPNEESRTLQAAREIGITEITEADSQNSCGLRMADMMVGIISRLLKSLCDALRYHSLEEGTDKRLLDTRWFRLNEGQLNLYKRLYKIICEWDHAWYKSYAGNYSDDLVTFIALLGYMNHFETVEQICTEGLEMQGEYFNSYVCQQLSGYFERRRNKLSIDPINQTDDGFFLNRRGAKVFFDITRQPFFMIKDGRKKYMVLSVGVNNAGIPLITIAEGERVICYRLPEELNDWVYFVVGIATTGERIFPAQVIFSKINGRYYADIL